MYSSTQLIEILRGLVKGELIVIRKSDIKNLIDIMDKDIKRTNKSRPLFNPFQWTGLDLTETILKSIYWILLMFIFCCMVKVLLYG
jgi:Ni2+-binding GTPase involved in maturation of urease and hydrogenase